MRVLAYDPVSEPPGDMRCADLGQLAARSDVITLHLPLTEQTRHLVDDAFVAKVKPGAVLVNCSRGGLIDTDAVWRALTSGRLSGVGLDVFDPEPPGHASAVQPPRRRPHAAPDGAEPAGHCGDLRGRCPGRPRRALRPRAASRRRPRLARLLH